MDSYHKQVTVLSPYSLSPNMVGVLMNLAWLIGDEVDLHLITGGDSLPSSVRRSYSLYRVPSSRLDQGGLGFAMKALNRYLRDNRPDLLMNVGQPFPLGVSVVLNGMRFGIPTLLRVTGNYMDEAKLKGGWRRLKTRVVHRYLLNFIYRQSSLAVPVGHYLAKRMIECGFEPEAVVPQPQPFNPEPFSPLYGQDKKERKIELGLRPDRSTILFVGRLTRKKGADRVQEIVQRVLPESNDFQFCLLGEGPYRDRFRRFETANVRCPGRIPRENVHRYFQVADLLLHPTRSDALPNVVLEALASETPVAASPVGEIPDYVGFTTTDVGEYVDYIISGKWKTGGPPEMLKKDKQKEVYMNLIKETIGRHG